MARKSTKEVNENIELRKLQLRNIGIQLEGLSPLIMHRWSEKARIQMLDKQMKKAKGAKLAKDPEEDFEQSIYRDAAGAPCFPAVAFKAAAVDAAVAMDMKKTNLRQSFHITGEMVPIQGEPTMREDMVRIGQGTADIRYRAEFKKWSCVLPVVYNAALISAEQVLNLFEAAGFGIGVGEWRPQRDGSFGMFRVVGGLGAEAAESAQS